MSIRIEHTCPICVCLCLFVVFLVLGLVCFFVCAFSFAAVSLVLFSCTGTAEVLPSVSKVAGVWRSLSWCLESVMLWRGIMGFTKFGDKRVNDLDLL